MRTVQVNGETQAVAPVQPVPPHWPYCWIEPGTGATDGVDEALEALEWEAVVDACDAEVVGPDGTLVGLAPTPGTAVGTVDGC